MRVTIDLEDLAGRYNAIAGVSKRPNYDIAEHYGVSHKTAIRRIEDARQRGLIDENAPRRGNPYLAAICEEMGVSRESMEEAIRKHAPNGNLRVKV